MEEQSVSLHYGGNLLVNFGKDFATVNQPFTHDQLLNIDALGIHLDLQSTIDHTFTINA